MIKIILGRSLFVGFVNGILIWLFFGCMGFTSSWVFSIGYGVFSGIAAIFMPLDDSEENHITFERNHNFRLKQKGNAYNDFSI